MVGASSLASLATVAELRELVAAKDYTVKQMFEAYIAIRDGWRERNAAELALWESDYEGFRARYGEARGIADMNIDAAAWVPVPDNAIPAPDAWNAIMKAIRQNWDGTTGGALTRGDLLDLSDRIIKAGGRPDYSKTPQPTAESDGALELFKAADVATKKIEAAAKSGRDAVPWLAVGAAALVTAIVVSKLR